MEEYALLPPVSWYQVNYERYVDKNYLRRYYALQYEPPQSKRKRRSVSTYDTTNGVLVLTAGTQVGCDVVRDPTKFCNGPLRPGQKYR